MSQDIPWCGYEGGLCGRIVNGMETVRYQPGSGDKTPAATGDSTVPGPGCPAPGALRALAGAPVIPRLAPSQWLATLAAPYGHANTRHDYVERARREMWVLADPAVSGLAAWAARTWPDRAAAMAGVLSVAPDLQAAATSGRVDTAWATGLVRDAVEQARAAARRRSGPRIHLDRRVTLGGVDFDSMPAVETEPAETEAARWAEQVTGWAAERTGRRHSSSRALLVVESNLPQFWGWYARRVGLIEAGTGAFPPPPPVRRLGGAQRLEDCLSGGRAARVASLAACSRLLLGPPRRNRWPVERGWQMGLGFWSLVSLRSWAEGRTPAAPPQEVLRWWSSNLEAIESTSPPWEHTAEPSAGPAVA